MDILTNDYDSSSILSRLTFKGSRKFWGPKLRPDKLEGRCFSDIEGSCNMATGGTVVHLFKVPEAV